MKHIIAGVLCGGMMGFALALVAVTLGPYGVVFTLLSAAVLIVIILGNQMRKAS